jgi:hypothetical protein
LSDIGKGALLTYRTVEWSCRQILTGVSARGSSSEVAAALLLVFGEHAERAAAAAEHEDEQHEDDGRQGDAHNMANA